jgi:hypothetical protein
MSIATSLKLSAASCSCTLYSCADGGLTGGRLIALLVDFGLVARRGNTSDVLLAYEM